MKVETEALIDLYNEADHHYEGLAYFHTRIVDAGLDETMTQNGIRRALSAVNDTLNDLNRRIKFSKVED